MDISFQQIIHSVLQMRKISKKRDFAHIVALSMPLKQQV